MRNVLSQLCQKEVRQVIRMNLQPLHTTRRRRSEPRFYCAACAYSMMSEESAILLETNQGLVKYRWFSWAVVTRYRLRADVCPEHTQNNRNQVDPGNTYVERQYPSGSARICLIYPSEAVASTYQRDAPCSNIYWPDEWPNFHPRKKEQIARPRLARRSYNRICRSERQADVRQRLDEKRKRLASRLSVLHIRGLYHRRFLPLRFTEGTT